ncbi:MAG: aminotransferase class V-fold PLP-dependent enzyme [Proteobacteria bacterium]|nr:aminotransferase class V-fold PLP-dependent enzyme [Pseudomonadota bacterium]
MNNLVKTMIHQMARRTGTVLSIRHWEILRFANEYYHKHKVGPLFHMMKQKLGATKNELGNLFPEGLNSVYKWVNIPIQTPARICKPVAAVKVDDFREVFLDHNGTTYLREEIKKHLMEFMKGERGYGNPSSSTSQGRDAYELVHQARIDICECLDIVPQELIFTSGGSESNNTAIKGIALKHLEKKGHFVTSKIEHPSALSCFEWLESLGFTVTYLDIDEKGLISAQSVDNAIREDTLLVSIMLANNEIGTISPYAEIGKICQERHIPFMVDAAQGFGKISIKPKSFGISLMSFTGHKVYAPKGVAGLFIDESIELLPLIHGGGQELGVRSGTENVPYISALGLACKIAHKEMKKEHIRIKGLCDYFISLLDQHVPGYILNGCAENRLVGNLNFGIPDVDSGALLLSLNQIGIYASSGSACHAGSKETSHVIKALGVPANFGNIRFSPGLESTKEDIDYLFKYLPEILSQLKELDMPEIPD